MAQSISCETGSNALNTLEFFRNNNSVCLSVLSVINATNGTLLYNVPFFVSLSVF